MIRVGSSQRSREQGYREPPVMYVPRDEVDYYMQTGNLPKALAANAARADLAGIRVPIRQDDGSFLDDAGNVMMCEDMTDYFARLRAAPPEVQQAAAEAMEEDDDYDYAAEEGAAASVLGPNRHLVVKKTQPHGLMKRSKMHN